MLNHSRIHFFCAPPAEPSAMTHAARVTTVSLCQLSRNSVTS
jgi:hypothetical protein